MRRKFIGFFLRRPVLPEGPRSYGSFNSAFIIFLFVGVVLGGVCGAFTFPDSDISFSDYITGEVIGVSVYSLLWNSISFFALALLFSTSYLGIVLLPSLLIVRGAVLSFNTAAIFSLYSFNGFYAALLIYGLPALFTVPAFIILCCSCYEDSKCLFLQRFHSALPVISVFKPWYILSSIAAAGADFLYARRLLPELINALL